MFWFAVLSPHLLRKHTVTRCWAGQRTYARLLGHALTPWVPAARRTVGCGLCICTVGRTAVFTIGCEHLILLTLFHSHPFPTFHTETIFKLCVDHLLYLTELVIKKPYIAKIIIFSPAVSSGDSLEF